MSEELARAMDEVMVDKLVTDKPVEKEPLDADQEGQVMTDRGDRSTVGLPFVENSRISARNVNVYYDDKHAINDVSVRPRTYCMTM